MDIPLTFEPATSLPVRPQDRLHHRLATLNRRRFMPALPVTNWYEQSEETSALMEDEHAFLEGLRAEIAETAAKAPSEPGRFRDWFGALKESGPGQGDVLFPWLAEHASIGEMRWFLQQEVAGEAGFDDLVALTQVKLPTRPKLELARNYWDEMGRGSAKGMHGPMLEMLAQALALAPLDEETVWGITRTREHDGGTCREPLLYVPRRRGARCHRANSAQPGNVRSSWVASARRTGERSPLLRPARRARRQALGRLERGSHRAARRGTSQDRHCHRRRRAHAAYLRGALLCALSRCLTGTSRHMTARRAPQ